jgi:shikimate dehydrogenase
MTRAISGAAVVAGVVGAPVAHSLSPLIHNAWLEAGGHDGVYAPFAPPPGRFPALVRAFTGGAIRGLNVTVPFKVEALALATAASDRARRAGAANVLVFEPSGEIRADNTDGEGLLGALAAQAPAYSAAQGPAVILGAGGAARAAAAALADAGAPEVRVINRTPERAVELARLLGEPVRAAELNLAAFAGARLIVNATSLGLGGMVGPAAPFKTTPGAVVLDMIYRPLRTEFLDRAARHGLATVDGLEMLIRQAVPSFTAFFGAEPPDINVRSLCLGQLGELT